MKCLQKSLTYLLLFILASMYAGNIIASTNEDNFIALSDIHFDPFYTCQNNKTRCPLIQALNKADSSQWPQLLQHYDHGPISSYGSDTNFPLLQSALLQISKQAQQTSPQFAFILGDFLAHDFKARYQLYSGDSSQVGYQHFVDKTLQFLTQQISDALPKVPIYPAIGNNDSYTGNYASVPNGQFYRDLASGWLPVIGKTNNTFAQTFPIAGYYAVVAPNDPQLRILVLNSVLFSIQTKSPSKNSIQAAQQQLNWLKQQLQLAALQHQKVWIAFHIPPGVNVYFTVKNKAEQIVPFWKPAYNQAFLTILNRYGAPVTAIISGHIHMDGFQIVTAVNQIPDTFVPSISPIYFNNPSFKIYRYTANAAELADFTSYYLPNNGINTSWQKQYDFNQVYQANCQRCNLLQGMEKIMLTGKLAEVYQRYYTANHQDVQPITEAKWFPYYWCGIHATTQEAYNSCLISAN